MALSIGELAGYLTLDDKQFEQGLNKAKGKFEAAGAKLKDSGKKLGMAAGAAAGAAIAAGLAANIADGKANDKLAAQLGLTEQESKRIGKVAGGLYRDAYGDSLTEVNDAVGAVMSSIEGMSNASGKRLEKVTAKALDFAAAFEIDVARSSQVAGQLIKTGLVKNATEAFDLLTAGSQKVPAALREDLVDAADEYGQFFAGLGYSGKQAFAMLVDASDKGMYGIDKAGDAIKEFTIRSTDMSTASKDAYASIGLDAGKMANAILAGGDKAQGATQKIIDGILAIKDPAKQGEAAIALFGTPIEDLGTKDIPKFLESLRGTSGAMDGTAGASKRMGDSLNGNFATRMTGWTRTAKGFVQDGLMAVVAGFEKGGRAGKGWKGDLSELGAFIKSPLLPVVKDVGRFVLDNAKAFAVAGIAVGSLVIGLKIYRGIVAVVTGVQLVATAATKGYALAKGVLGRAALGTRIQLGLMAAQTAITTAVSKAATVATKGWAIAQRLLNAAMRANPIGIVITVLVALGTALVVAYKKSETFRKIVDKAWNGIVSVARWAWNNVLAPIFRFYVRAIGEVMIMWGKMLRALSKVPGFGWAKKAGDVMVSAGEKAVGLSRKIKEIPDKKHVSVSVDTTRAQQALNSFIRTASGQTIRLNGTVAIGNAARAKGGPVTGGETYLVGEKGPELFAPGVSGTIIPNHRLPLMEGAGYLPKRSIQPGRVPSRQPELSHAGRGGVTIADGAVRITMPATMTPEAAAAAAGGRTLAALSAWGV